jgi:hypothetical protein
MTSAETLNCENLERGRKMEKILKDISEVYEEGDGWGWYDYNAMLETMGEIVIKVDDHDYQGDSRVLFHDKDTDQYGYLIFGWGSCSGCDALQSCSTLKEVDDLRYGLYSSIIWKDKGDMLDFFENRDWETKYEWHAKETKEFVEKVTDYLIEN